MGTNLLSFCIILNFVIGNGICQCPKKVRQGPSSGLIHRANGYCQDSGATFDSLFPSWEELCSCSELRTPSIQMVPKLGFAYAHYFNNSLRESISVSRLEFGRECLMGSNATWAELRLAKSRTWDGQRCIGRCSWKNTEVGFSCRVSTPNGTSKYSVPCYKSCGEKSELFALLWQLDWYRRLLLTMCPSLLISNAFALAVIFRVSQRRKHVNFICQKSKMYKRSLVGILILWFLLSVGLGHSITGVDWTIGKTRVRWHGTAWLVDGVAHLRRGYVAPAMTFKEMRIGEVCSGWMICGNGCLTFSLFLLPLVLATAVASVILIYAYRRVKKLAEANGKRAETADTVLTVVTIWDTLFGLSAVLFTLSLSSLWAVWTGVMCCLFAAVVYGFLTLREMSAY